MSTDRGSNQGLASARILHRRLRGLGDVEAPAGVLGGVFAELGLGERYVSIDTPIGPVFVAYAGQRISAVSRASDDADFEWAFRQRVGRMIRRAETPPADLLAAIQRHLGGERSVLEFDLRYVSEFERAVLLKALEIPRGEVRPYGWIAREIGRPGAVRAVGSALHKNPIPLLIPCHRVVRSDGQIGEYAYGPDAKTILLAAEGLDPVQLTTLARQRTRFLGNDRSGCFCLPTCHRSREASASALQPFASAGEARAAGYRACPSCRPATEAV